MWQMMAESTVSTMASTVAPQEQRQIIDGFTKYTNDATRLQSLLLCTGDFNLQSFANKHYATQMKNLSDATPQSRAASNPQDDDGAPSVRKTHISFELHPSIFMEELLEELYPDEYNNNELDDEALLQGGEEEEDYDINSLVERQRRGAQSKTDRDWGKGGGIFEDVSHY